jgi:pimeloyl-ACP methyl ester carboxylesterase
MQGVRRPRCGHRIGGPVVKQAIQSCLNTLAPTAGFYTAVSATHDIEAVRRALELGLPTVFEAPYGTQVAAAYSILFPNDLQGVALDSAYSLTSGNPMSLERLDGVWIIIADECEIVGCDPQQALASLAVVADTLRTDPVAGPDGTACTAADLASIAIGMIQSEPARFITAFTSAEPRRSLRA